MPAIDAGIFFWGQQKIAFVGNRTTEFPAAFPTLL
jgi:hypothetical protein